MALPPAPASDTAFPSAPIAALLSHPGDPRDFRRFTLRQESGICLVGEMSPLEAAVSCAAFPQRRGNGNFHSITVRNLSMTGLYFVTKLPYREGLRMEIRIPLEMQMVNVMGTVQRLDRPASTVEGILHDDYGCGVDFVYPLMTRPSRRAIMDFLLAQSQSAQWNELPGIRSRFPRPHPPRSV